MITEAQREKDHKEKLENGIQLCEQAIQKAEKYERLSENADWKEYLEDLKVLVGVHDREINLGVMMLQDAPNNTVVQMDASGREKIVSSKQDWTDFIIRHQIQKHELENWLKEPEQILKLAKTARNTLPKLKDDLASIGAPEDHAERNGKS